MSDDRRTQLLELVKKEFIGPDPIEWPGYKQANGEEILVSDPPRTRYIAGILYPQETPEDETSVINEKMHLRKKRKRKPMIIRLRNSKLPMNTLKLQKN